MRPEPRSVEGNETSLESETHVSDWSAVDGAAGDDQFEKGSLPALREAGIPSAASFRHRN